MIGSKKLTSLALMAGVAVLSTSAQAFMVDDAKILIDRALNSPTLTIKYSGAAATMVELKVNGTSFGTRTVPGKSSGETNFTLDLSQLADGENDVEVLLYDKDGALVGKEKTTIRANRGDKGPVFLVSPKVGSTVRGTMDIKVGFGKELKDTYVSFFVDNQFRKMTNTPPYSYLWDTTREGQGWHEVEAWVVTGAGDMYKTTKTRVFVDNPGGRVERPIVKPEPVVDPKTPVGPPIVKPLTKPEGGKTEGGNTAPVPPAPTGILLSNVVSTAIGATADLKPVTSNEGAVMMDQRNMPPKDAVALNTKPVDTKAPVGNATVKPPVIDVKTAGANTTAAAATTGLITIAKGQRLPNMSPMTIMMNSRPVIFDVAPRIENGIPLTPFRHLFESSGGTVDWDNVAKELSAAGDGNSVWLKIGNKVAKVNKIDVDLEIAPFLERGRTIVPLSFIKDSLSVDVQYDPATGHVLITKAKKN